MAIAKIILNGVTQMDLTGDTVTADKILSPYIAHKNDGTQIIGTHSDSTPTIQSLSVAPSTSQQSFNASGVDGYKPVTVSAVSQTNLTADNIKSGTTVTISNGTSNLWSVTGTYSGGGGASNVVTGTFKGTTTGAAMDVTLNYSGTGYPVAVLVFVDEGIGKTDGTFYNTLQRYANAFWYAQKRDSSIPATYSNTSDNYFLVYYYRKNSTSSASSLSGSTATDIAVTNNTNASSTASSNVRIKSRTSMSVFIASNSQGFMANILYRYVVVYSS